MFLDCPAHLDQDGTLRCGLPAEVSCRFTMRSTDGPLESAMIRCPAGHHFTGAIESLTWPGQDDHDPGTARAGSRTGRDSLQRGRNARHTGGGSARRELPAEPKPKARRPHGAPAYYLGRPAALYITAMRPRPRHTTFPYLTEAAVSGRSQPRTPARSSTVDSSSQAQVTTAAQGPA
jgi:hypothetical protein